MSSMHVQSINRAKRPLIEWIVGGLSALFIFALLTWLSIQCIWGPDARPLLRVEVGDDDFKGSKTGASIRLVNDGGRLANAVKVVVTLTGADRSSIRKEMLFDEIGPGEEKLGRFLAAKEYLTARAEIESYIER